MSKQKFEGFASKIGSGEGELINEAGNRTWYFSCGCIMTSEAGAYGSNGSAYNIEERCPDHAYDQDGNLIQD